MYTGYVLPFQPKKGQAFSLPAFLMSGVLGRAAIQGVTLTWHNWISKDFGAFVAPTNTPVVINATAGGAYADGCMKLNLTATEMNADVIIVRIKAKSADDSADVSIHHGFIIYTDGYTGFGGGGGSGGVSWNDTIADIEELSDENPTIREVLSFLWIMLRKSKNRRGWTLRKFIAKG